MTNQPRQERSAIRYSLAFKLSAVREVEAGGLAFSAVAGKYGIKGIGTVGRWVRQYGNGTRGKIMRMELPNEINELKELRARVRRLEQALGTAHIDLALERAFTVIACERAGITDVAAFKKKADLPPGMGR